MLAGAIVESTASVLAEALRHGRVSAVAVVEALLDRIAAVNPELHALVQVDTAGALSRALAADRALARGDLWGPLHGVPFTVKDVIDTAGIVSAAGLPERAHFVPAHDAVVVTRMKAAGAILLGKSNCPPGGGGGVTDNPVYGPTHNPHDPRRSPGGSSGGEAAAVASGMSPLGLGSDSGGSLRVPAHFCGVASLKPSSGRVPATGVLNHPGGFADFRTQVGPIARSVQDLWLVLTLIAGEDGCDPGVLPLPLGRPQDVPLAGLRVALLDARHCTPATQAALEVAAARLRTRGATVCAEMPAGLDQARRLTERVWRRDTLSGAENATLTTDWDDFRRRMLGFMADHDLLLGPVAVGPAPLHGDETADRFDHTMPWSLTGWPCVVLPAGNSPEGLPIGVQLVARMAQEHVAAAAALAVEAG